MQLVLLLTSPNGSFTPTLITFVFLLRHFYIFPSYMEISKGEVQMIGAAVGGNVNWNSHYGKQCEGARK